MSRRNTEMFNLSFLDVLSGALGAVIFLFIITPKGGRPAAKTQQVTVAIDTLHKQVFGSLHDSLLNKDIGDTLLVLVTEFKKMPSVEDCPDCPPPIICPECPKVRRDRGNVVDKNVQPENSPTQDVTVKPDKHDPVTPAPPNNPNTQNGGEHSGSNEYNGDPPSVPCKVSFEVIWEDIGDNVDLFVCKGKDCVYGASGKRNNNNIGQWDPGKSKTKFLGSDLRTTQEAVRQFDKILPGTYKIYAHFKESGKGKNSVSVKGLVYTRGVGGREKGETFFKSLPLSKQERTLLGTVELKENGEFIFIKN